MHLPIRSVFAALLWGLALVPPALYVVHLSSPVAAVQAVEAAGTALRWGSLGAGGLVLLGLLLYPPFLPAVRLTWRALKGRLSSDRAALREAQARLLHLETAADHLVAGRALLLLGQAAESLPHLVRAVELDPDHAASRYQLGLALARACNLPAAVEQLGRTVELDPDHAFGAALLELGIALERGGADEQAVRVLERHEQKFGEHRRNLFHRARALSRLGRREDAVAVLRRAAHPPEQGRALTPEDDLIRARARVALLTGGRL